jgi:hypothetical protein
MDENGIVIRKSRAYFLPVITILALFIGVLIYAVFLRMNDWADLSLWEYKLYYKGTYTTYYIGHTKM